MIILKIFGGYLLLVTWLIIGNAVMIKQSQKENIFNECTGFDRFIQKSDFWRSFMFIHCALFWPITVTYIIAKNKIKKHDIELDNERIYREVLERERFDHMIESK